MFTKRLAAHGKCLRTKQLCTVSNVSCSALHQDKYVLVRTRHLYPTLWVREVSANARMSLLTSSVTSLHFSSCMTRAVVYTMRQEMETHHSVLALDRADHPPRRTAGSDNVLVRHGEEVTLLNREFLRLLGHSLHVVHHLIESARGQDPGRRSVFHRRTSRGASGCAHGSCTRSSRKKMRACLRHNAVMDKQK